MISFQQCGFPYLAYNFNSPLSYKIYNDHFILLYSIALLHGISFFCLMSFTFKPFPSLCVLPCNNMQVSIARHVCVLLSSQFTGRLFKPLYCIALQTAPLKSLYHDVSKNTPQSQRTKSYYNMECDGETRLPCIISVSCYSQYACVSGHISYHLPLYLASHLLWGTNQLFFSLFASYQIQGGLSTHLGSTVTIHDNTITIINEVSCQSIIGGSSFCYFRNEKYPYFCCSTVDIENRNIASWFLYFNLSKFADRCVSLEKK